MTHDENMDSPFPWNHICLYCFHWNSSNSCFHPQKSENTNNSVTSSISLIDNFAICLKSNSTINFGPSMKSFLVKNAIPLCPSERILNDPMYLYSGRHFLSNWVVVMLQMVPVCKRSQMHPYTPQIEYDCIHALQSHHYWQYHHVWHKCCNFILWLSLMSCFAIIVLS